jgi:hypothetical protein
MAAPVLAAGYGYSPKDYIKDYSWIGQLGNTLANVAFKMPEVVALNKSIHQNENHNNDVYNASVKTIQSGMTDETIKNLAPYLGFDANAAPQSVRSELVAKLEKPISRQDPGVYTKKAVDFWTPIKAAADQATKDGKTVDISHLLGVPSGVVAPSDVYGVQEGQKQLGANKAFSTIMGGTDQGVAPVKQPAAPITPAIPAAPPQMGEPEAMPTKDNPQGTPAPAPAAAPVTPSSTIAMTGDYEAPAKDVEEGAKRAEGMGYSREQIAQTPYMKYEAPAQLKKRVSAFVGSLPTSSTTSHMAMSKALASGFPIETATEIGKFFPNEKEVSYSHGKDVTSQKNKDANNKLEMEMYKEDSRDAQNIRSLEALKVQAKNNPTDITSLLMQANTIANDYSASPATGGGDLESQIDGIKEQIAARSYARYQARKDYATNPTMEPSAFAALPQKYEAVYRGVNIVKKKIASWSSQDKMKGIPGQQVSDSTIQTILGDPVNTNGLRFDPDIIGMVQQQMTGKAPAAAGGTATTTKEVTDAELDAELVNNPKIKQQLDAITDPVEKQKNRDYLKQQMQNRSPDQQ